MKDAEEPSLSGFLEEVALIADIDTVDTELDRVLLMTLHAAKGLEFPVVYLAGMEEGLFPGQMSIDSEDPVEAIEEERRLCYVGITRAKQELTLLRAHERFFRGESKRMQLSRFVREIPRNLIDLGGRTASLRPALPDRGLSCDLRDAITKKPSSLGKYENPYLSKAQTPAFGKPFLAPAGSGAAAGPAEAAGKVTPTGGGKDAATSGVRPDAAGSQQNKSPTAPLGLGYGVGEKVRHVKFGVGTVLSVKDRGRDYEVTVDFPAWGPKKMFAAFAKLVPEG